MNLIEFNKQFPDEASAIKYLESIRWNGKPVCPHCDSDESYRITTRNILKCKKCRRQFTVRVGTIFEDSHLPLRKWFLAIYLLTSRKKGQSSVQIAKDLGITQKSAWFVLQRIRYAVSTKSFNKPLDGKLEVDETYYGGAKEGKRGRGSENKTPVFGMAQREGELRVEPVENVKSKTLMPIIRENIKIGSTVISDELLSYNKLDREGYDHKTINHRQGEYARYEENNVITTNSIEGFWSHLKKGIDAIYIHVSKKHLGKYCYEYSFRYNTRKLSDYQRFVLWFEYCKGKHLTYKSLIGN